MSVIMKVLAQQVKRNRFSPNPTFKAHLALAQCSRNNEAPRDLIFIFAQHIKGTCGGKTSVSKIKVIAYLSLSLSLAVSATLSAVIQNLLDIRLLKN